MTPARVSGSATAGSTSTTVRPARTEVCDRCTALRGDRLDDWLTAVETDEQPELRSFAAGIRRDYDAVRNGLTLHHNSGPVEGHVNRIKMIKRRMYGRANLDLLRKRVLLA